MNPEGFGGNSFSEMPLAPFILRRPFDGMVAGGGWGNVSPPVACWREDRWGLKSSSRTDTIAMS
jgi:hypothetical protein